MHFSRALGKVRAFGPQADASWSRSWQAVRGESNADRDTHREGAVWLPVSSRASALNQG